LISNKPAQGVHAQRRTGGGTDRATSKTDSASGQRASHVNRTLFL
jgi:hypothetical protein